MTGTTDHYGLLKTGPGDSPTAQGYKATTTDRDTIDRLLYQGATGHHHTGASGALTGPTLSPSLTVDAGVGNIPASTRVYYKYTYLDQYGNETAASPQGYIDTPAALASPGGATLSVATVGGTLISGSYYYVLSAYEDVNTQETLATSVNFTTIGPSVTTGKITLTLPSTPSGADGFNIYRKKPGGSNYFYLDSVDMSGVSPPTIYVDTGIDEDCNRVLPIVNSSNATNSIEVTLPGATPTVPEGYTWKIYRTYIQGNYAQSLLHHVVELDGLVISPTYTDLGTATTTGTPPTATYASDSPSQIDLATETTGLLPVGNVEGFPFMVTFTLPGTVTAQVGTFLWVCEFPIFEIRWVRASLGMGSVPVSQEVIVDVNLYQTGATPTYVTLFTDQVHRPNVGVGETIGIEVTPDITTIYFEQALTVDVDQAGGSATPTDEDLTVNIYGWASF